MTEPQHFPPKIDFQKETQLGLASPWDRFAAVVVDFSLLIPIVQFLQAPLRRWILEAILFEDGNGATFFRLSNLVIFVGVFVVYHGLCTYWTGQTIGKLFFRIRVVSMSGPISLGSAFLRSFCIFFELLFAGLPHLSLFSHPLRRAIHDRVSDTLVMGSRQRAQIPSAKEARRASVLFFFGALAYSLIVFVGVVDLIGPDEKSEDILVAHEACENLIAGQGKSTGQKIDLFLAKKISASCLYRHSRSDLWDKESAQNYFAVALSLVDQPSRYKTYLEKTCNKNPDNVYCLYSRWVLSNERDEEAVFSKLLDKVLVKKNKAPDHMKVLLLSQMIFDGQFKLSANLLKTIKVTPQLRVLLASLNFHVLMGEGLLEKAELLLRTHPELDNKQVLQFVRVFYLTQRNPHPYLAKVLERFFPDWTQGKSQRGPASVKNKKLKKKVSYYYDLVKDKK